MTVVKLWWTDQSKCVDVGVMYLVHNYLCVPFVLTLVFMCLALLITLCAFSCVSLIVSAQLPLCAFHVDVSPMCLVHSE